MFERVRVYHTSKRLLNVHHLPRTRLHEPIPSTPRPIQSLPRSDLPHALQITLVPRNDTHRQDRAAFHAIFFLHLNQLVEIVQGSERGLLCDVVDEQKGVGSDVGRGPETAVFFLAGGVGEGERVGGAVDGAGYGVGVFDCGVVSAGMCVRELRACSSSSRLLPYSCVHWLRTRRNVMDDLPQPPSPQTVMVILWFSSMIEVRRQEQVVGIVERSKVESQSSNAHEVVQSRTGGSSTNTVPYKCLPLQLFPPPSLLFPRVTSPSEGRLAMRRFANRRYHEVWFVDGSDGCSK